MRILTTLTLLLIATLANAAPTPIEAKLYVNAINYVYDEESHLIGEYSANGRPIKEYIWIQDIPVAIAVFDQTSTATPPAHTLYYIHVDHLNTPRQITDQNQKVVWRWDNLDVFGNNAPDEDPDHDGIRFTFNLRFPGQYFDEESGLFYNLNRYYDPKIGRYIQPDPIGLNAGNNRFNYVNSDPLRLSDPSGLEVTRWTRPADIGPGGVAGILVDHHWLKTDKYEAGMGGMVGLVPAQEGRKDALGDPVQTVNHLGQYQASNARQIAIPFPVDEQCVDSFIKPGQRLGNFKIPGNNCQSFADEVLDRCRIDPVLGRPARWYLGTLK